MLIVGSVVWLLGQVVLGRAVIPPMPGPEAISIYGMVAFASDQESELNHNFADYDTLLVTAFAPGHGLPADVYARYCSLAESRAPLARALRAWVDGPVTTPSARDAIRIWSPAAVVDSLVAADRALARVWLDSLAVDPSEVAPGLPVPAEPLIPPAFADAPCAAPGAATAPGSGAIVGVARTVDGVLVQTCGVFLSAINQVVMTDKAGRFEFCSVPPGPQALSASHVAFRNVAGTVPVVAGQVTQVELILYAPMIHQD